MTALIYVANGCHFCIQLEDDLRRAGIPFNTTFDNSACGFGKTPGTYLNGNCYGYDTYDIGAQYNKIAEDYSKPTASPTPTTTPTPTPKPAAAAPAAATTAKTVVWAKETLTIKWGGVSGTAAKTYEDLMLEATNPVPPDEPVGLTIALRDHKKAPTGRKIA